MDKKRLNHEQIKPIKQGEIDAWHRGKSDALRNKLLAASQVMTPSQAVMLIKMFAKLGDVHYLAMKLNTTAENVRAVLRAFDVNSIEDAKSIVENGIIAELTAAEVATRETQDIKRSTDYVEAQKRLDEQQAAFQFKTPEEIDQALAQKRDQAQRANKEDRLRQLIAEGLDPNTKTRKFRIPLARVREFKQMIPHGVFQLQRSFGGSKADIVAEIKRLSPGTDLDVLRP